LKAVLRAYDKMEWDAFFTIAGRLTILLLVMALGQSGHLSVKTITVAHLSGASLECLGLMLAARILSPIRFIQRSHWEDMKMLLLKSMPFAVFLVLGILYLNTGAF